MSRKVGDGAERHHVALGVARPELGDVADFLAERPVRLGGHAEGPAEEVEVVDVGRPDVQLEGLEHLLGRDAQHLRAHPVDVGEHLGRAGVEQREHAGEPGRLVGGGDQLLACGLERLEPAAAPVLQPSS